MMLSLFCDRALSACEAAAGATESLRTAVRIELASEDRNCRFGKGRPTAVERTEEHSRACGLVKRLNELLHLKRAELTDEIVGMVEARATFLPGRRGEPGTSEPRGGSSLAARAREVAARFQAGAAADASVADSWSAAGPSAELEYWKQQNRVCAKVVGDLRRYAEDMRTVDDS